MKKAVVGPRRTFRSVLLTILAVIFILLFILPLAFTAFDGSKFGNVALIPLEGIITGNGGKYLGQSTVSAQDVARFIEEAEQSVQIQAIVLEINSPGGSAVASDEIASALKKTTKPSVAFIREIGTSGGYWVASAADYIIANRMSITGSIGVTSSYLEFSGLMDEYGIGYQRLVAGERKDVGTPFRKLTAEEHDLLQQKLDKIHGFFIEEIAANRELPVRSVRQLATGEFYLGVEALDLGLIDQLGDKETLESYLQQQGLEEIDYVLYRKEISFIEALTGVFSPFFFTIGEGFGAILLRHNSPDALLFLT